jgi:hypothetical protein
MGYQEEIYAYGMRNPWRMSFDDETGQLWCADVGQDLYEEINIIENGGNYGWAVMEASHCYESPWECAPDSCDPTGMTDPIWEYDHSHGLAAVGGYVYHGADVPSLFDRYIFADWFSGNIWALEYDGMNPPVNTLLLTAPVNPLAFGTDEAGELYLCAADSVIYELRSSVVMADIRPTETEPTLRTSLTGNSPNPFNPSTRITYQLGTNDHVLLTIHNILGERVRTLVDGFQSAGVQNVTWDGKVADGASAASGMYFYRLETGSTIETRKMLLTK